MVVAAGGSSRLGRPKQLVQYRGQSLLRRACFLALDCGGDAVTVVLGAQFDRMQTEIADLPVRVVNNESWAKGMSTSLRAGLNDLPDWASAVMILLVDQPLIVHEHLFTLIESWQNSPDSLTACYYSNVVGVPAIIPRRYFGELWCVTGDQGARALLSRHRDEVDIVLVTEAGLDVDTEGDLAKLQH